MEIKGSAVKSIPEFVKTRYTDQYENWKNALPEGVKEIFEKPVLPSNWYPLSDGGIVPTETLGKVFFNEDSREAAWQAGRFSAEIALTGIYKFFVKASTPHFIIARAGKIFSTYYRPSEMKVMGKGDKSVNLQILKFDEPNEVIEYRIAGWMEKGLEISGCKNVRVSMPKSLARGDEVTEFDIQWE